MFGATGLGSTPFGMPGVGPAEPTIVEVEDLEAFGFSATLIAEAFVETAVAVDTMMAADEIVDEVASATDEVLDAPFASLVEVALAGDAFVAAVRRETAAMDVALATDSTAVSAGGTIEEATVASDSAVAIVAATIIDAATATDATSVLGQPAVETTSNATATDGAEACTIVLAESVGQADDTASVGLATTADSVATASDATETTATDVLLVADSAVVDDALVIRAGSVQAIDDHVVARDAVLYPQPELTAWVMNTETAAVSWYTNWGFTGMAQAGDRIFAVGPAGLVELGDSRDDSARINARVEYDFNEFGGYDREGNPLDSEYKKRVENFWVGYVADGRLKFQVETYGQGYGVVNYVMEPRTAAQPRNSRVKPGKGLNARWWKVAIENVAGANFEITSLSADVAQSNRRA